MKDEGQTKFKIDKCGITGHPRNSYSIVHGNKDTSKASCWGDKKVKLSSKRLLCGTNEEAEDLTGQRKPVSSSR